MDHFTYVACHQEKFPMWEWKNSAGGSNKAKEQSPSQKVQVLKSNEQWDKKNTVSHQKIFLYCVSRNYQHPVLTHTCIENDRLLEIKQIRFLLLFSLAWLPQEKRPN